MGCSSCQLPWGGLELGMSLSDYDSWAHEQFAIMRRVRLQPGEH